MELSFSLTFAFLMCLLPCTFAVLHLHSRPLLSAETKMTKSKKFQRNGTECINKIPNYEQNSM